MCAHSARRLSPPAHNASRIEATGHRVGPSSTRPRNADGMFSIYPSATDRAGSIRIRRTCTSHTGRSYVACPVRVAPAPPRLPCPFSVTSQRTG